MPTMKVNLDSSASSLALNANFNQVVIAGSHIFKIYSIEDNELCEKVNLYAAKNRNPNFSSSDVVWNPVEENKLATVATNGAVVTWDLLKPTRSKLDRVFIDQERPVNKVSFHPSDASLLISGLQGGLMKLFDTRTKEAVVTTYTSNTESVRDIQFSPHITHYFAAGTENGNVQFWDMRKTDRTENQFTEHRGPVFALDWHPEYKLWIATASRDRTIKVWDMNELNMYSSIRTVASVGRVKWRPNKNYHLASCSCALAMDCSISVWDIRRPYIPFSAFHEHRDVTTGIAWQGNPYVLLSVGKDSTLFYHSMEDATHPIENTNPVALDTSPNGLVAVAKPKPDHSNYGRNMKQRHLRKTSVNDSFGQVFSSLNVFREAAESFLSSESITHFATNYKLTGKSLSEICEHNAQIAKRLSKYQIAATWQIIQIIYSGCCVSNDCCQGFSSKEDQRIDFTPETDSKHVRHVSGEGSGDTNIGTGGVSAEDETETDDTDNHDMKLMHIASGVNVTNDFFFGDDEISPLPFDYDNLNNVDPNNEWMLPNEAFQPRRDIVYRSTTPPEDFSANNSQKEQSNQQDEEEIRVNTNDLEHVMASSLRICENELELPPPPPDFTPLVIDVLQYYANLGDVQMSVTLIIVLGDRIKNFIDEAVVEHWFMSYIDILHRLRLWNTATEIIQHASWLPQVQNMYQHSTSVKLQCGNCGQSISYGKKFCKKCGSIPSRCAVCHCAVQGLFVWCQGCSHGGHLMHLFEWFSENTVCPTGCGHECEFT
ncbi:UNVERIFIED_CONTAM: hypothetical protein RMT77_005613 [Armadillidium vulgare]